MVLIFLISLNSVRNWTINDADKSGRKKLYQSADIAILLVKEAMQGTYGICKTLFDRYQYPDIDGDYRLGVLKASYGKKQIFNFSYNVYM